MNNEPDKTEIYQAEALDMLTERRYALADMFTSSFTRNELKGWQVDTALALEHVIGKSVAETFNQIPFPDQGGPYWRFQAQAYAKTVTNLLDDLAIEIERIPQRYFPSTANSTPDRDSQEADIGTLAEHARVVLAEREVKAKDILDGKYDESQIEIRVMGWKQDTTKAISAAVNEEEARQFSSHSPDEDYYESTKDFIGYLKWGLGWLEGLKDRILEHPEYFFKAEESLGASVNDRMADIVYIMHGSDMTNAYMLKDMLTKMGIKARFLSEEPSGSRTLREMLDDSKDRACFVFVLLTSDDTVRTKRWKWHKQPRPNALIELGYYLGYLGRDNVVIVCQREVHDAMPSDLKGIRVAMFEKRVKEALGEIQNELREAGLYGD